MTGWSKLPKDVRTQIAVGTILTIVGMVWMFLIVFVLRADQILPTKETVSAAHEGMRAIAGIPFDAWTLRTAGELAGSFLVVLLLNILFVVARYGGLTMLFLGAFAIFEAVSSLRKARH